MKILNINHKNPSQKPGQKPGQKSGQKSAQKHDQKSEVNSGGQALFKRDLKGFTGVKGIIVLEVVYYI